VNKKDEMISFMKNKIKNLEKEIDDLKNQRYDNIADCGFEIDFKELNVFSIEREIIPKDRYNRDNREATTIGYKENGKLEEWNLSCSRETHERLVKEFKAYIRIKHQS